MACGCQVVKGAPVQALSLLPVFPILFIPNEILLWLVCQSVCQAKVVLQVELFQF